MINANRDISIKEIEIEKGIVYDDKYINEGSLPKWYHSIREKNLSQLSDGDLARLIRQNMYLEYILYEAIKRLYKNPCSGEKYAGELIESMSKYIEASFWIKNKECKNCLIDFLSYFDENDFIKNHDELDDFEKREVIDTINNFTVAIKNVNG